VLVRWQAGNGEMIAQGYLLEFVTFSQSRFVILSPHVRRVMTHEIAIFQHLIESNYLVISVIAQITDLDCEEFVRKIQHARNA
jgi:hypothetical protein